MEAAVPEPGAKGADDPIEAVSLTTPRPPYTVSVRRTSEASGKLMVSVQVSPTGSVCSASITNDEIHSPEITSCVLGKFRSSTFPPPSGGCTTVNIPISFSIKQ